MVLDGKCWKEYPVNAVAPQGSILGPTLFLLYFYDLPDDVTCNIAICADDTPLYSKCSQTFVGKYTVDQGKKWLVDFNAGKT